jgi:hypothetical protein
VTGERGSAYQTEKWNKTTRLAVGQRDYHRSTALDRDRIEPHEPPTKGKRTVRARRTLTTKGVLQEYRSLTHQVSLLIWSPPGDRSWRAAFDQWKAANGRTDLTAVTVLQDNLIRCIISYYGTYSKNFLQVKNGFCDAGPDALAFNGCQGVKLDPNEYIIGIAGR